MKNENLYTKTHIKEIHDLFSEENELQNYTLIHSLFYSGAKKKTLDEVNLTRKRILNITESILNSQDSSAKSFESEELTNLLRQFRNNSTTNKESAELSEKEQVHYAKSLKNLVSITDGFAKKIFKYDSPTDFASSLVQLSSNPETKHYFADLQAYSTMAKKRVNPDYQYTAADATIINNFEKKYNKSEKDLNSKDIYTGLATSYSNVAQTDFVKAAAKTNYLKKAGVRWPQILKISAITLGATFLTSLMGSTGFPTESPSATAFWSYVATYMLPYAAAGLLISGGSTTTTKLVERKHIKKVRNAIKNKVNNKVLFFELLNQNRPEKIHGKGKKAEIDLAITNFESALKRNAKKIFEDSNYQFSLGRTKREKRKNYLHLLKAEDKINNSKKYLGAPLFSSVKKDILDHKSHAFSKPNTTSNQEFENKIANKFTKTNPAAEILLNTKGTKTNSKTGQSTNKVNETSRKAEIIQPTYNFNPGLTPAFALENEPTKDMVDVNNSLGKLEKEISDANTKKNTAKCMFKDANSTMHEFEVSFEKNNAKVTSKMAALAIKDLKNKMVSVAETGISGVQSEYSYGSKKKSIDVSVTYKGPKKKK